MFHLADPLSTFFVDFWNVIIKKVFSLSHTIPGELNRVRETWVESPTKPQRCAFPEPETFPETVEHVSYVTYWTGKYFIINNYDKTALQSFSTQKQCDWNRKIWTEELFLLFCHLGWSLRQNMTVFLQLTENALLTVTLHVGDLRPFSNRCTNILHNIEKQEIQSAGSWQTWQSKVLLNLTFR